MLVFSRPHLPRASRLAACRPQLLVAPLSAALLAFLISGPASAHSELLNSSPAGGSSQKQPPATITLEFNQEIASRFASVAIDGPAGDPVALDAEVAAAMVSAQVPRELAAGGDRGAWSVSYRVVSADGHPIVGSVDFTVEPSARDDLSSGRTEPTPIATPGDQDEPVEPTSRSSGGSDQGGATVLIGLFTAAMTLGGVYLLSRGRRRDQGE